MTNEQSKAIYKQYFGSSDPTYLYEGLKAAIRSGNVTDLDEGINWHATRLLGDSVEAAREREQLAEALRMQLT